MSEKESGKVPRLMVFPDRPDCLVVYLPNELSLQLPTLVAPFSKESLARACAQTGLDLRISDGTPGKWGAAYRSLRKAEAGEKKQRQHLYEARKNAERLGSKNLTTKSRGEAISRKNEIDEKIRVLKTELGKARSAAFTTGKYLPPDIYRNKERQLQELKTESQALQTKIGELRIQEHAEHNNAENKQRRQTYAELFMQVAQELLPEIALQKIYDAIEDEESTEP